MPPSRNTLIGPIRTQSSPTPVGPPRPSLPGNVVEPRGDLLAACPPGLKLRATLTRTVSSPFFCSVEVQVEVAAAGVAVGDAGDAVLVVQARTASSPPRAFSPRRALASLAAARP